MAGETTSVSSQRLPNFSEFTVRAMQVRAYTFLLRDEAAGGDLFAYSVERNGQSFDQTGELTLFLNPEELIKDRPAKKAITQTANGAWVDSFGLGLPTWTMKGSTGLKARRWHNGESQTNVGAIMDGYMAFHAFTDLIANYYDENRRRSRQAAEGGPRMGLLKLLFRDHTDDEWWEIEPEGLPTKIRGKDRPLTAEYLFRFTGLIDLKQMRLTISDPTGLALVGGNGRFARIATALGNAFDALQAANDDLKAAGDQDPTGMAVLDALSNCQINTAQSETEKSAIARVQAYASARAALSEADAWESGHTPSSAQQAALDALNDKGVQALAKAGCSDPEAFEEAMAEFQDSLDTAEAADILEDPSALSETLDESLATVAAEAVKTDVTKVGEALSFTKRMDGFLKDAATFVQDVQDKAASIRDSILTPLKTVQGYATKIRNMMQTVASVLDTQILTAPFRQALRMIRTQLRGMLCAVQSVLAFPYNFVKGLRNTLQDIFNLFSLSGCASTFPSIKAPSWKPSLPLTIPSPVGA